MTIHRLAILAFAACNSSAATPPAPAATVASGHYCNMSVFTADGLARHKVLAAQFHEVVAANHELADGYSFDFPGTFEGAGEWLDGVRRCCPTVDFKLAVASHIGPATLQVTGVDAKPFIHEEFARLFK
jgi:hypothetical protein